MPGSFSTAAAWRGIQEALPDRFRIITTSLLGYGHTAETRSLDDFDMDHEVRMLAAVGERVNEPVHLVGHSFGATVGFAAVLAGVLDVLSITTFEANPIPLIRKFGHGALFAAVQKVSTDFECTYLSGEPYAARRIIDYWGGDGSFASMPKTFQEYCQTTTIANVLDWRSVYTFRAGAEEFGTLAVPTLLVRGQHANAAMLAVTDALSDVLPNSTAVEVGNANHFLTTTHISECAALLADHLDNSA